jgi:hypothetical protein
MMTTLQWLKHVGLFKKIKISVKKDSRSVIWHELAENLQWIHICTVNPNVCLLWEEKDYRHSIK